MYVLHTNQKQSIIKISTAKMQETLQFWPVAYSILICSHVASIHIHSLLHAGDEGMVKVSVVIMELEQKNWHVLML